MMTASQKAKVDALERVSVVKRDGRRVRVVTHGGVIHTAPIETVRIDQCKKYLLGDWDVRHVLSFRHVDNAAIPFNAIKQFEVE